MCAHTFSAIRASWLCGILSTCGVTLALAQTTTTITAMAAVNTAGGTTASAPITIEIRRHATDAERDELLSVLKGRGTADARTLLAKRADVGTVRLGGRTTMIKYAYTRATADGELVTVVTAEPMLFLGAGLPAAPARAGYELGLVLVEVTPAGGQGELAPAAKLRVDPQGAIVTEDYSAQVVRLSQVVKK